MILPAILLLQLILMTVQQNRQCDAEKKNCYCPEFFEYENYLFYDVNPPEGFNLRRDVYMRFAHFASEATKTTLLAGEWWLILPPWYGLYHWRTDTARTKPIPWSTYFEVDELRRFAPVLELNDYFARWPNKPLEIDVLYVLLNYEDPFEGGVFEEKWEIEETKPCEYTGKFWGYKNITVKETVCVKFQGKISQLWDVFYLHQSATKFMVANGEIPLHDEYGTRPYWDCRKSMKFNKELVDIANNYIRNILDCNKGKCTSYISVHWRRADFSRSRRNRVPSIIGTASQIDQFVTKTAPRMSKIFIATDGTTKEINSLEKLLVKFGYKVYFYIPNRYVLDKFMDGGVAIIEQIICTHGAFFIGTHESTFSLRIQEEREIIGFDPVTTFNRLCPDVGVCEKPSKWLLADY